VYQLAEVVQELVVAAQVMMVVLHLFLELLQLAVVEAAEAAVGQELLEEAEVLEVEEFHLMQEDLELQDKETTVELHLAVHLTMQLVAAVVPVQLEQMDQIH
jgi:hypothetical protein